MNRIIRKLTTWIDSKYKGFVCVSLGMIVIGPFSLEGVFIMGFALLPITIYSCIRVSSYTDEDFGQPWTDHVGFELLVGDALLFFFSSILVIGFLSLLA